MFTLRVAQSETAVKVEVGNLWYIFLVTFYPNIIALLRPITEYICRSVGDGEGLGVVCRLRTEGGGWGRREGYSRGMTWITRRGDYLFLNIFFHTSFR